MNALRNAIIIVLLCEEVSIVLFCGFAACSFFHSKTQKFSSSAFCAFFGAKLLNALKSSSNHSSFL